jgi:hypothetical protein
LQARQRVMKGLLVWISQGNCCNHAN